MVVQLPAAHRKHSLWVKRGSGRTAASSPLYLHALYSAAFIGSVSSSNALRKA
jgi:hypothetical protein